MTINFFEKVRKEGPLVHSITNYVTANDCANIILAAGARPIMADAPEEVYEITSLSQGLFLNLGTPSRRSLEAMMVSGKRANDLGLPILFDPVGVTSSSFRRDIGRDLLSQVKFSVIRGNPTEIKGLSGLKTKGSGVDVEGIDMISKANLGDRVKFTRDFSKKTGAIIVVTGREDLVSGPEKTALVKNGHPLMAKVTGTGCMLSALISTLISSDKDDIFQASLAGVLAMGLAGERAFERMDDLSGSGTYRSYIIDAIFKMTDQDLLEGGRYEII